MLTKLKIIALTLFVIGNYACEEEGEPITINDLYSAGGVSTAKFSTSLNNTSYESEIAAGLFVNQQLVISAVTENANFAIGTSGIGVGVYNASQDSLKNYISYRDKNGVLFLSNKPGKKSNVIIEIVNYDEEKKVISGKFSGTLYDAGSDSEFPLKKGQFTRVEVDIPYFGEMQAVGMKVDFNSETCIYTSSSSGGFTFETIASSANSDTLSLSITLEEKIQVKEYDFASDPIIARYNANVFSGDVFKNLYTSETGKVNITKVDTINDRVEGTFNFIANNFLNESIEVEEGAFVAIVKK